jgi:hypothetical protein
LIASALDPDRLAGIRACLVAAAGEDLAPHNEAWSRYQLRRLQAGLEAEEVPLALAWERRLRLFTAGESMWCTAMRLADMASAVIDEPVPGSTTSSVWIRLWLLRPSSCRRRRARSSGSGDAVAEMA